MQIENREEKSYFDMCKELYDALVQDECMPQKEKDAILSLLEIIGEKLWKYSA